ncbi:MAG: DUF6789 family protein [Devosia sp.]
MVRAITASAISTAILSALIYANMQMGFLPSVDIIGEVRGFNGRLGFPASEEAAWLTHALIGVLIYGITFSALRPILPGRSVMQGAAFGIITWLVMMVFFMPLAGHEVFAQDLGGLMIGTTLAMHLLFGIFLSITYSALSDRED